MRLIIQWSLFKSPMVSVPSSAGVLAADCFSDILAGYAAAIKDDLLSLCELFSVLFTPSLVRLLNRLNIFRAGLRVVWCCVFPRCSQSSQENLKFAYESHKFTSMPAMIEETEEAVQEHILGSPTRR